MVETVSALDSVCHCTLHRCHHPSLILALTLSPRSMGRILDPLNVYIRQMALYIILYSRNHLPPHQGRVIRLLPDIGLHCQTIKNNIIHDTIENRATCGKISEKA